MVKKSQNFADVIYGSPLICIWARVVFVGRKTEGKEDAHVPPFLGGCMAAWLAPSLVFIHD